MKHISKQIHYRFSSIPARHLAKYVRRLERKIKKLTKVRCELCACTHAHPKKHKELDALDRFIERIGVTKCIQHDDWQINEENKKFIS